MNLETKILANVRNVPDFPSREVMFKDINPLLRNCELCNAILDQLQDHYEKERPDAIAAIESRGFFFGFGLALRMGIPFIPIRKAGKLPGEVASQTYDLEYGSATIEIQKGIISLGDKILIHDDVLATGGTAQASAELVLKEGGIIGGFNFLISLDFLKGQEKLEVYSSKTYNLAHV